MLPELHIQFRQTWYEHWFAVGLDFKRIVPRLKTENNISVVEHVNSVMAGIMADITIKKLAIKTRLLYAENASEMFLIGGYAVDSIDPFSDYRTYIPIRSVAWWVELRYAVTQQWQPALFVAYARNLGAKHTIFTNVADTSGTVTDARVFGFATNVQQMARIAPRVRYRRGPIEVAAELEYTRALQGQLATSGKVVDAQGVGVARCMVAMYYYF
jgi:hypothetical protein